MCESIRLTLAFLQLELGPGEQLDWEFVRARDA